MKLFRKVDTSVHFHISSLWSVCSHVAQRHIFTAATVKSVLWTSYSYLNMLMDSVPPWKDHSHLLPCEPSRAAGLQRTSPLIYTLVNVNSSFYKPIETWYHLWLSITPLSLLHHYPATSESTRRSRSFFHLCNTLTRQTSTTGSHLYLLPAQIWWS